MQSSCLLSFLFIFTVCITPWCGDKSIWLIFHVPFPDCLNLLMSIILTWIPLNHPPTKCFPKINTLILICFYHIITFFNLSSSAIVLRLCHVLSILGSKTWAACHICVLRKRCLNGTHMSHKCKGLDVAEKKRNSRKQISFKVIKTLQKFSLHFLYNVRRGGYLFFMSPNCSQ